MPAESKKQQRFFGMVHAVQKGELSPSEVGPAVRKAAKNTDYSDAKDIASTKHKNLPEKKASMKEEVIDALAFLGVVGATGATSLAILKSRKKKAKEKLLKKQGSVQMRYFEKQSGLFDFLRKGSKAATNTKAVVKYQAPGAVATIPKPKAGKSTFELNRLGAGAIGAAGGLGIGLMED